MKILTRTQTKLLEELQQLSYKKSTGNYEGDHIRADDILLELINNEEVAKAFEEVGRWYA